MRYGVGAEDIIIFLVVIEGAARYLTYGAYAAIDLAS